MNTRGEENGDICWRTVWVDARTAIHHVDKGRAHGNRATLCMRKLLQDQFYQLGEFSEVHAGKIIFVAFLLSATFCVGLKSTVVATDLEQLWVQAGGRLQDELNYRSEVLGHGYGTTNQILIQTPKKSQEKNSHENILTSDALLSHLDILFKAVHVSVDMFDISWNLNDLCYATSFPYFENHLIDQIFERLTPCAIVTPLDCFWEGSKLLGPRYPVKIPGYGERVKWTNLNPQKILEKLQNFQEGKNFFKFSSFSNFMKRSGISTAYQQKPCLNPSDPECPAIAPNKLSKKLPDIGAEITGGCYGFAGKYLHWPEELISGGSVKNRTRHIVRASAFQSIVQLMGENDMYEHWRDHYKVHNIDWSKNNAKKILEAWVKKFADAINVKKVEKPRNEKFDYKALPSTALDDVFESLSAVPVWKFLIACVLTTLYTCLSSIGIKQNSKWSFGLSISGVFLIIASVFAGLGLCSVLGLPFTVISIQVLPFLSLALGLQPVFVFFNAVRELELDTPRENLDLNNKASRVGHALKRCGPSILATSVCKTTAFLAAAIIPVPGVRIFCIEAAIVLLACSVAVLFVQPAFISLDLRRKDAARADIFCCFPVAIFDKKSFECPALRYTKSSVKSSQKSRNTSDLPQKSAERSLTQSLFDPNKQEKWVGSNPVKATIRENDVENNIELDIGHKCCGIPITNTYSNPLMKRSVKSFVILFFTLSLILSCLSISKLDHGLKLTNLVPRASPESSFLEAQQKYFGFYNMFAITKADFEYPTNQKLLHEYQEAFNRVPWIIKNDNGGLPDSWLVVFRNWLIDLQKAFDKDWERGHITEKGWTSEASDNSVLAYKLLVQTGHVDHPVETSLLSQNRLVNSEGIINPKAFYNYLTAWVTNDALAYSASQANLNPPPRFWSHERSDTDLLIPKSSHLVYAQFPFYLNELKDSWEFKDMIKQVRDICNRFEAKGLPNFPAGVPFTFWEQYLHLDLFVLMALASSLLVAFVVLSILFINTWTPFVVVCMAGLLSLRIAGVFGWIGLKMSAVSAISVVASVGFGVEFSLHIVVAFVMNIGDRNTRVNRAFTSVNATLLHITLNTFLVLSALLFSESPLVVGYMFLPVTVSIMLSFLDGVIVLPVILSVIGPPSILIPCSGEEHLPPPSPGPPPYSQHLPNCSDVCQNLNNLNDIKIKHLNKSHRNSSFHPSSRRHSNHYADNIHASNLSLTTITEEPSNSSNSSIRSMRSNRSSTRSNRSSTHSNNSSSREILVEPQFVVETTTYGSPPPGNENSVGSTMTHHVTTKVTATAKVKVELHSKSGSSEKSHKKAHQRNTPSPYNVSVTSSAEFSDKKSYLSDKKSDSSDKKLDYSDRKSDLSDEKTDLSDKKLDFSDNTSNLSDKKLEFSDKTSDLSDIKLDSLDRKSGLCDKKSYLSDQRNNFNGSS